MKIKIMNKNNSEFYSVSSVANLNLTKKNKVLINQGPLEQKYIFNAIDRRYLSSVTRLKQHNLTENGWHAIDWKKAETKLTDLQEKIVIAKLNNDMKEVYNLQ
jgi:hypothetical protein